MTYTIAGITVTEHWDYTVLFQFETPDERIARLFGYLNFHHKE